MFSTPSYGEWTKTGINVDGDTFYVDFERIRKHDGYVYFWRLSDYLKPILNEYMSDKGYQEVDCNLLREKDLSLTFYNEPMGGGSSRIIKNPNKDVCY